MRFFDYCTTLERVIVVLVDGTICVYQVDLQNNNTFLERQVSRSEVKDSAHRPLAQDIKAACLASTVPPAVDIEASNDNSSVGEVEKKRIKERRQALEGRSQPGSDRLLVLGAENGSVVFLDVKQLETVHARFFFHRAAITHLVELPKQGKFISTCEEYNLCVWGFDEEGLSA